MQLQTFSTVQKKEGAIVLSIDQWVLSGGRVEFVPASRLRDETGPRLIVCKVWRFTNDTYVAGTAKAVTSGNAFAEAIEKIESIIGTTWRYV